MNDFFFPSWHVRQWLTVDASVAAHTVGVRRTISSVRNGGSPGGAPGWTLRYWENGRLGTEDSL